jgi:small subunit ribosomal protein S9
LENVFSAAGKRKRAIANVILKPGKGERIVNKHSFNDYLKSEMLIMDIEQPFQLLQVGD